MLTGFLAVYGERWLSIRLALNIELVEAVSVLLASSSCVDVS